MRRTSSRVQFLRSVPMFAAFTDKELAAVARAAELVDVPAGEVLVEQGKRGHEFYVIADGKAEVTRDGRAIAVLGAGDFFGELAVLDPHPRTASVTMTSDGQVLILSQREFFGLLDAAPVLARKLLIGLARRLHRDETA